MRKDLSQIANDLFASPSEGKELSSQIKRLGVEMRKVLHSDDAVFGKFRGLLESFREVIPDERQRYHAALKALSTTSKLDAKEIMKTFRSQLEELKAVEKDIMPFLSGWSDGLKTMEAKLQQLKGEIASLRGRLAQLESEENDIQTGIAAREKDLKNAEKSIKDLFADIGREMTDITRKIGELTGEAPVEEPVPLKGKASGKRKKDEEKNVEITVETVPMDSKYQRKCPMCGGSFNLHEFEKLWQCYTCGHEEPASGAAPGGSGSATAPTPDSAPPADAPTFSVEPVASMVNEQKGARTRPSLFDKEPLVNKKSCPACQKTMFWHPSEKAWRCPSCGYERRI